MSKKNYFRLKIVLLLVIFSQLSYGEAYSAFTTSTQNTGNTFTAVFPSISSTPTPTTTTTPTVTPTSTLTPTPTNSITPSPSI